MNEGNIDNDGADLGFEGAPFAADVLRVVPTTEAQREVWLADQLGDAASLAYNESASLWFDGPLDLGALDAALALLVDRHEALRSTIGPDGTELWVGATASLKAGWHDFSALDDAARARALEAERVRAVETRFDLANGPLVRAELMRSGPQRHELMLTAHHIACDGWSLGVIASDLVSIYRAFAAGEPSMLDPAPRYSDHALAQRQPAALARQAEDERWWVALYDQSVPTLDLPADRPRTKEHRSFASRRVDEVIDPAATAAIKRLGAAQGTSLFTTLFTLYAALLARLAGTDEVVVGVPAAGQLAAGEPGLVGHCVNLLPVRVQLDLDGPVAAQLERERGRVLDAYEHQGCTFGSLLKKLDVQRDPARLPLVSVMFNLDAKLDSAALSDEALRVRVVGNPRRYENFELFLNVTQDDGGLRLECQYNTQLFDEASVRRWLALYRCALERSAEAPATALADVLAPTPSERALFDAFNATGTPHDRSLRVEALLLRQAARTPDAIAIVAGERRMTYGEFARHANALAHELRRRDVGAGDLVGIACGRNAWMFVALLGVLQSGAGYVPLDPALPRQRLEFMAQDAGLRCVLGDASVEGEWPFSTAERIAVDGLAPVAEGPAPSGSVDDPCYCIYTSGSTGTPKGVRVPHRSVVNLLLSLRAAPRMDASNRVLAVTTLSFDIAVSEVIAPLACGARVVVADRAQAMDGQRLRELIEREEVDLIDGTPATYRLLVESGWAGRRDLVAICIGEPLPPDLARLLIERIGELWNAYGPTETTVWSTMQRVLAADGPVPIGRPIENTQIHVADAKQRLMPLGAVGELFIAGEGVTLGYLNRPELTAERFLPPPPGTGGTSWYRTGDLGRWRADGILECLGRIDHQVKVRGYRIELGEIETALQRHADVAHALVVTREDKPGDVRIVAYVIPADTVARGADGVAGLDDLALRQHLSQTLPTYMIPQHFVAMASFPRLHNGKLDRHALPRPAFGGGGAREAERTEPANDVERRVLAAMEAVLNLPGMGVRDNFFSLGGHSLLALRLTTRLNAEFSVSLPLRTLFESSTAEALAHAIEAAREHGRPAVAALRHEVGQSTAPLTLAQERMRFLEEVQPGRVLFNTPSGHRLTGPMDAPKFEQALREIVRRQPVLRTRIAPSPHGDGWIQAIADDIDVALPVQDLSGLPAAEREAELMARLQAVVDTPIDIHDAPLFRVALYKLADEEHAFFLMAHHIVWDGWSFDVFYEEMAAIYGALVAGEAPALPPLSATYGDFAHWQADWMEGPECQRQLQFWKQRFADAPLPRAPATDKPRTAGVTGEGSTEPVRFDAALTERLREVARRHDVTLSMLAMSVYATMLAAAVGSPAIVIGLPVRGRLMPEIEATMGLFVNLLPITCQVDPARPLGTLFTGVKRELMDAFEHQEIPFVRLASEPGFAGRARSVGLYQALFSFQDARERKFRWGPLQHAMIPLFQKGAAEDLGLWLIELPEGLAGGFTYNADVYLAETAVAFRERYVELMTRIAGSAEPSVASLVAADTPAAQRLRRLAGAEADAPALVAPRTPVAAGADARAAAPVRGSDNERILAGLWAETLAIDVDHIRSSDNFFDLGGHSLLAMRVVEASTRELGFAIDARRYFYESLAQLAAPQPGSAPVAAPAPAPVAGSAPAAAAGPDAPRGLLRRLFGSRGDRAR